MANESQEQINQRLTDGVAANTASISALAAARLVTEYKGIKSSVAGLPASGNKKGDFWYVTADSHGYFWSGVAWEDAGAVTRGADGVSPSVTITQTATGHTVVITDATHPSGQSFGVSDGTDGYSPIVTTNKVGKVTTVTITDSTHQQTPHSFTVNDGNDGQNGQNGQNGQDGQDGADARYTMQSRSVSSGQVTLVNQAMNNVTHSGATLTVKIPALGDETLMRDMAVRIKATNSGGCTISISGTGETIKLESDNSTVISTAIAQNSTAIFLISETNRVTSGGTTTYWFAVSRKDVSELS